MGGEPACQGLIKGLSHAQEYFVEDMIEVLMYVSRFRPQVLEGVPMEELLLFFVTFMGSPAYIKNPYLRSRMVEVSHGLPYSGASPAQHHQPSSDHGTPRCRWNALHMSEHCLF